MFVIALFVKKPCAVMSTFGKVISARTSSWITLSGGRGRTGRPLPRRRPAPTLMRPVLSADHRPRVHHAAAARVDQHHPRASATESARSPGDGSAASAGSGSTRSATRATACRAEHSTLRPQPSCGYGSCAARQPKPSMIESPVDFPVPSTPTVFPCRSKPISPARLKFCSHAVRPVIFRFSDRSRDRVLRDRVRRIRRHARAVSPSSAASRSTW